jgi:hypothetical protein
VCVRKAGRLYMALTASTNEPCESAVVGVEATGGRAVLSLLHIARDTNQQFQYQKEQKGYLPIMRGVNILPRSLVILCG